MSARWSSSSYLLRHLLPFSALPCCPNMLLMSRLTFRVSTFTLHLFPLLTPSLRFVCLVCLLLLFVESSLQEVDEACLLEVRLVGDGPGVELGFEFGDREGGRLHLRGQARGGGRGSTVGVGGRREKES